MKASSSLESLLPDLISRFYVTGHLLSERLCSFIIPMCRQDNDVDRLATNNLIVRLIEESLYYPKAVSLSAVVSWALNIVAIYESGPSLL
ncbi:2158_t:CDS:1, partial [Acaulospora colombiana]